MKPLLILNLVFWIANTHMDRLVPGYVVGCKSVRVPWMGAELADGILLMLLFEVAPHVWSLSVPGVPSLQRDIRGGFYENPFPISQKYRGTRNYKLLGNQDVYP